MIKSGDIILFKGKGFVFTVLSFLIGLFDKSWRKREWKPWHMAVSIATLPDLSSNLEPLTWMIEATSPVVRVSKLDYNQDFRSYHWLDEPPTVISLRNWYRHYMGKPYDRIGYLWTAISYIIYRWFGRSWRFVDTKYFCWELGAEGMRHFGKELQPLSQPPMINKILPKLTSQK